MVRLDLQFHTPPKSLLPRIRPPNCWHDSKVFSRTKHALGPVQNVPALKYDAELFSFAPGVLEQVSRAVALIDQDAVVPIDH